MKISVVGGGYVGLVSSVCFAELGHSVDLIEIDEEKVEVINYGKPPIYERGLEELMRKRDKLRHNCIKLFLFFIFK